MTDLYIDTAPALARLCARLRGSPWLALDTEFIREKTYYPELCLVQVADESLVACIDALALPDLGPLLEILYDPAVIKVLHSAHQDLEIFFHLGGAAPGPVFDTQIAATLLGQGEHAGYATLIQELLGVTLDKSQTRTDWRRRPLTAAQLAYAGDDVRYLRDLYRWQRDTLERQGRLAWLDEDFAALGDPSRYRPDAQTAWRRIKGHDQLGGVQLAALRALAAWRETRASASNRPRQWLVRDAALLELARRLPAEQEELPRLRELDAGTVRQYGKPLLNAIAAARREPPERWPRLREPPRLSPRQEALVDVMMALVRLRSAEAEINPQLLASRRDLERLLAGADDVPLQRGWRAALVGGEVQALLRGELRLEVRAQELVAVAVGAAPSPRLLVST